MIICTNNWNEPWVYNNTKRIGGDGVYQIFLVKKLNWLFFLKEDYPKKQSVISLKNSKMFKFSKGDRVKNHIYRWAKLQCLGIPKSPSQQAVSFSLGTTQTYFLSSLVTENLHNSWIFLTIIETLPVFLSAGELVQFCPSSDLKE